MTVYYSLPNANVQFLLKALLDTADNIPKTFLQKCRTILRKDKVCLADGISLDGQVKYQTHNNHPFWPKQVSLPITYSEDGWQLRENILKNMGIVLLNPR